jgi:hypothetical protein
LSRRGTEAVVRVNDRVVVVVLSGSEGYEKLVVLGIWFEVNIAPEDRLEGRNQAVDDVLDGRRGRPVDPERDAER